MKSFQLREENPARLSVNLCQYDVEKLFLIRKYV